MKLHREAGERPEIDLSGIVFAEGYLIPRSSDLIASGYQKGFPVGPDVLERWFDGEMDAIASEFVMHYYRSMGFGDALQVQLTGKHPDDPYAVVVIARDADGIDWMSHTVWPANGRLCISRND